MNKKTTYEKIQTNEPSPGEKQIMRKRKKCPCCDKPRTCELHVYLCPDGRCECTCSKEPTISQEQGVRLFYALKRLYKQASKLNGDSVAEEALTEARQALAATAGKEGK